METDNENIRVDITYALSPQAEGKVERSDRWLQDRIVRTCAIEKLTTIEEVRSALREEVDRYDNHQVHSTIREISQAFVLREPGKKGIACLGHLSYQSHIPQPKMSSAYERNEWPTDIAGYLCLTMK